MSIHTSKRDPIGSHFSWSHRVNAFVVVLLLSALSGWGVALTLPRGPVTALQSLIVMGGGVLIGLIAGSLLRSRWAMLLVPVVHLAVLEIGRWSSLGPTVDALRLDSAYGILALLLGRGWYALVGLAPMVFGAGVGAMLARGSSHHQGWLHWVPTAVGTVMFAGFAVLIALPARTPPMLGADGAVVPGSLSELRTVPLNGRDQTIMIRAQRTDRPVLLYLSGGPGQSDLPYTRVLLEDLTRDFVLVGWDQRGTGKSYASLEPTSSLTLEGAVEDAIALTSEKTRFTSSGNPGAAPWRCSPPNAVPSCTTPSSAVGRWSASAKPTAVCTTISSPSPRRPVTNASSPRCAGMVNRHTPIFRTRTPS
jgi:proline iminopeptidase